MSELWSNGLWSTGEEPPKKLKRAIILVAIDPEEREDSSSTRLVPKEMLNVKENPALGDADEVYEVTVTALDPTQSDMLDTAAHELGHVLSAMFDLPGGMKDDPRTRGKVSLFTQVFGPEHLGEEERKRLKSNEVGAWNIGRKIRPELSLDKARKSLRTYCKAGWWDCDEPTL
jgi:hypothetical protein